MKKGIIGKKVGMTQIFDEIGNVIPVTVIEAGPCVVVQKKTVDNDGYDAVQLGFGGAKEKHLTKADLGHFKKAGCENKKHLKEFRLEDAASMNVGSSHSSHDSRYRSYPPSGRFHGRELHSFESVQEQEDGRSVR